MAERNIKDPPHPECRLNPPVGLLEVVPADRGRPLRRQLRWRKRDEGHTDDNESHRAAQEMGAFRQAALVWSTPADVGHPSQMAGFASVGLFCLLYIVRVSGEPMTELRWMPVFSVIEATRTVHAAHPTQATTKAPHLDEQAEDFRQRVGTAIENEEGGFTIYLYAVPLNGKLLVRPPQPGERLDPRQRG